MGNKLIVLSMDAMVGEDIEYLKTKPNFNELLGHCCRSMKAQTIYPSITYPAHVSMATGCTCGKHGIFNNTHFPSDKPYADWHLYSDEIQVEDIFAAAKRAGKTTAAIYWPVMGNNPNIDYNINEYFFPLDDTADIDAVCKRFKEMGANKETLEVVKENRHLLPFEYKHRTGRLNLRQTFDDFIMGCTNSMIRSLKPDVLYVHNCILDSLRHKYGIFNEYVTWGLDMTDVWLGDIIKALKEAGTYETTNFVLCSDHGQMDFARRIKLNVMFARYGFCEPDENGKVKDGWKARIQSNGMSASIYVSKPEYEEEVYEFLKARLADGVWGFGKIYTKEEAKEKYGFYGKFSFVVETDGYTTFADGAAEPIINPVDFSDYRLGNATHGYEPEKGPQPVLCCQGPDFKQDVTIPFCLTLDEAPTMAKLLGDSLPEAEGRVLTEFLA